MHKIKTFYLFIYSTRHRIFLSIHLFHQAQSLFIYSFIPPGTETFYLFIYSTRHRVLYHCCPHSFKIDFDNSTMFQHLKLLLVDFTAHALLESFRSCDMPGNVNDILMNDSFFNEDYVGPVSSSIRIIVCQPTEGYQNDICVH